MALPLEFSVRYFSEIIKQLNLYSVSYLCFYYRLIWLLSTKSVKIITQIAA